MCNIAALSQEVTQSEGCLLRLYVAGKTQKSVRAIDNLRKICEIHLESKYNIEVIDLIKHPEVGKADQILVIPTLVRRLPTPIAKIVGDLSNVERVLTGLSIIRG